MKKKWLILLVCVLTMCLLVGCTNNEANPDGTEDPGTQQDGENTGEVTGWDYIVQKGTLVVGLDDTFAPMGFRDEAGNLVGFDIDLANAVGELLEVEVVFQPIDWNSKEMELSSKRVDCLWNGMSATPERQESMSLTKKYLNNRIVIMALNPDVQVNSVEDLANYSIGTQEGSASMEVMEANEAYDSFKDNVTGYPTYDEALLDMQAGRVDCIVVDEVLGEYKNSQMTEKMTVMSYNFGDDFYAIGCRKEDADVAAVITEAIQSLIDSGKAAEISNTWFGKDIVILEDY